MIKVYSKILNEIVYFINTDEIFEANDGLIYRKPELKTLIAFHPTEEQLKVIHETKRIFKGIIK